MISRIREVHIRNYKSIGQAVVQLGDLTLLVGPNGAGKSNFVDALSFVQQCLSGSIELAFKNRGGIGAVRRRSGGHPTHVGIRLILDLDPTTVADYSFEISARPQERFHVANERCVVDHLMGPTHRFVVRNGEFQEAISGIRPRVSPDRLALFAASATDEFRPVWDFLTGIRVYSIVPERIRDLQEADPGISLNLNGSNAAAVIKRLQEEDVVSYERLCRLLASVVAGLKSVGYRSLGQMETLEFRQDVGLKDAWAFDALNMSDGTLRMLGLLLAVYQREKPSLLAIEEPEATVHPAAAEVITSVLLDAAKRTQILITTHSPDILESKDLHDEQIRVVTKEEGRTVIAPLSASSRSAIRENLYTAGELLRTNELNPDLGEARNLASQLSLFGPVASPLAKVA
jgi:predicted ATPase